jgi:6,7-dimethyl-8-ribityllumazine synthase
MSFKVNKTIEGELVVRDAKIALLASRFNSIVVDRLIEGAIDALVRHGAQERHLEVIRVPGAFELPLAAKALAESKRFHGLVALGAVVRGDTAHFDYVAGPCTNGLAALSLEYQWPIGLGVLTTETMEQALDRAGGKAGNKGADAALSVVEMISVLKRLKD